MNVILLVSAAVMVPMMRGPPQGSPLNSQGSRYSEQELKKPAGSKSTVGKISMVASGHGPDANNIAHQRNTQKKKIDARPKDSGDCGQVEHNNKCGAECVDLICFDCFHILLLPCGPTQLPRTNNRGHYIREKCQAYLCREPAPGNHTQTGHKPLRTWNRVDCQKNLLASFPDM